MGRPGAVIGAGLAGIALAQAALAQMPLPAAAPPDGATLFKRQCATCHTLRADEPARQGPPLGGVIGRKAGSVPGFKYSAGLSGSGWTWDAARIDSWITNPQAMVPGTYMLYHQPNPATRALIVKYLASAS